MKKTFFATLTFVLSGLAAQAFNESTDRFQQLIDLAHQGQPASFNQDQGIYVGRCYSIVNRMTAENSVLGIFEMEPEQNDGPLFSDKIKVVIEGSRSSERTDYYDTKPLEQLTSELMYLKSSYSSVVESPLSVVMKGSRSHTLRVYKNKTYILGLVTSHQDQEVTVRGGGSAKIKKGDIWIACYYFIKK
ncbi:MAG: hypothetical protein AABY64_05120 [Bdellovibrionota bacterium]